MCVQALCLRQTRYLLSFTLGSGAEIYGELRKNGPRMNANPGRSAFIRGLNSSYLSETTLEAEPPKLLRTVMLSGFVGQGSEALKRLLPLFFNVPTRAPVAVT